jgi:hypothetical protein
VTRGHLLALLQQLIDGYNIHGGTNRSAANGVSAAAAAPSGDAGVQAQRQQQHQQPLLARQVCERLHGSCWLQVQRNMFVAMHPWWHCWVCRFCFNSLLQLYAATHIMQCQALSTCTASWLPYAVCLGLVLPSASKLSALLTLFAVAIACVISAFVIPQLSWSEINRKMMEPVEANRAAPEQQMVAIQNAADWEIDLAPGLLSQVVDLSPYVNSSALKVCYEVLQQVVTWHQQSSSEVLFRN